VTTVVDPDTSEQEAVAPGQAAAEAAAAAEARKHKKNAAEVEFAARFKV